MEPLNNELNINMKHKKDHLHLNQIHSPNKQSITTSSASFQPEKIETKTQYYQTMMVNPNDLNVINDSDNSTKKNFNSNLTSSMDNSSSDALRNIFAQFFPHSRTYQSCKSSLNNEKNDIKSNKESKFSFIPNKAIKENVHSSISLSNKIDVQPENESQKNDSSPLDESINTYPLGVALSGCHSIYNSRYVEPTSKESSHEKGIELNKEQTLQVKGNPITIYKSRVSSTITGERIAINDHYICYPTKKGLIRLINRHSVSKTLLRCHENNIVKDLAFFSSDDFNVTRNLLLSSGTDNKIYVTELYENKPELDGDDNTSSKINIKTLAMIPTAAEKVKWHPIYHHTIIIAVHMKIYVLKINKIPYYEQVDEQADDTYDIEKQNSIFICDKQTSMVNDFSISRDGQYLVAGEKNGFVCIYNLITKNHDTNKQATCIQRFSPFTLDRYNFSSNALPKYSIDTVTFINKKKEKDELGLIVGYNDNHILGLWKNITATNYPEIYKQQEIHSFNDNFLDTGNLEQGPVLVSKIEIKDGNNPENINFLKFKKSNDEDFILIADQLNPVLYILHISQTVENNIPFKFDIISEFSIDYPILSMAIMPNKYLAKENDNIELYCCQTEAIQHYAIKKSPLLKVGNKLRNEDSSERKTSLVTDDEIRNEFENNEISRFFSPKLLDKKEQTTTNGQSSNRHTSPSLTEKETDIYSSSHRNSNQSKKMLSVSSQERISGMHKGYRQNQSTLTLKEPSDESTSFSQEDDEEKRNKIQEGFDTYNIKKTQSFERLTSLDLKLAGDTYLMDNFVSEKKKSDKENVENTIKNLFQLNEQRQKDRANAEKEVLENMLLNNNENIIRTIDNSLSNAIQTSLKNIVIPAVARIVLHTFENSLIPALNDEIRNSNKKNVEIDTNVITKSFRDSFQSTIIPSFQAATQKMFDQISDTLVNGLYNNNNVRTEDTNVMEKITKLNEKNDLVMDQMTNIIEMIEKLDKKIDNSINTKTNDKVSLDDNNIDYIAKSDSNSLMERLDSYLYSNDYQLAFQEAISAQDMDIVFYVLKKVKPEDILENGNEQISMMLILCLIQQLGCNLLNCITCTYNDNSNKTNLRLMNEEETNKIKYLVEFQLEWIKYALLAIDVEDSSIRNYIGTILTELFDKINQIPIEFRISKYFFVRQILDSILATTTDSSSTNSNMNHIKSYNVPRSSSSISLFN